MNLKEPQLSFDWITGLKADENFPLPDNSPQRRGNGTPVSENFTTKLHIGEMAKFDSQFCTAVSYRSGTSDWELRKSGAQERTRTSTVLPTGT